MTEPSVPAIWATLDEGERAMTLRLCLPSMRRAPHLLRLRWRCRHADLANRCVLGPGGQRWQFAKYLVATGRLSDDG